MTAFRHCSLFLLRYVPDVVKGEFVNIGVVLLEESAGGFTGVRFTRDWRRARCLDPELDVALLASYEDELRRLLASRAAEIINYKGPMSRREWLLEVMQHSFSGALELAPMQAVLTESPEAELGKLAHAYLESEKRAVREAAGRRVIYNVMRGAFEQAGVWALLRKDIAVAQYAPGDPLKIDCGYRVGTAAPLLSPVRGERVGSVEAGGIVRLFHAVSLASDVNSAKVLAFSYPALRDGILKAEGAMSSLTAVTEGALDTRDPAIAFALAALQDSAIEVARAGQMPEIAERARAEMRL